MLADEGSKNSLGIGSPGVFAVPCPPLVGAVPFGGEWAYLGHVLAAPFREFGADGSLVSRQVIVSRKAREILDRIVEGVAVDVVDVVPLGDRAVCRLPDLGVKVPDAGAYVPGVGSVILPICRAFAVGIAPELHAVEHNGFPFSRHMLSA